MPKPSQIPPSDVAELIRIASQHGLSSVKVRQGDRCVEIRLAPGLDAGSLAAAEAETPASEDTSRFIQVLSPMTGVFYVASSPTDPAFIHPGDIVHVGDPIGVIEAMKVFSDVLSEHSGRVRRVFAANGKLVQQGEPLVELVSLEPGEI